MRGPKRMDQAVAKIERGMKDCTLSMLIIGVGPVSDSLCGLGIVESGKVRGVAVVSGVVDAAAAGREEVEDEGRETTRSVCLNTLFPAGFPGVDACALAAADATDRFTFATATEAFALRFFAASLAPENEGRRMASET